MLRDSWNETWQALKKEPWAQLFIISWILFDVYLIAQASGWIPCP